MLRRDRPSRLQKGRYNPRLANHSESTTTLFKFNKFPSHCVFPRSIIAAYNPQTLASSTVMGLCGVAWVAFKAPKCTNPMKIDPDLA